MLKIYKIINIILVLILILTIGFSYFYIRNIKNTINVMQIIKTKNEKILPYKYLGNFKITFYCPCSKCVGNKKIVKTCTGNIPVSNKTVAVDKNIIPLHSILYIENLGYYVAEDVGGHIKGNRIDVFVDNHTEALNLGIKNHKVYLLK